MMNGGQAFDEPAGSNLKRFRTSKAEDLDVPESRRRKTLKPSSSQYLYSSLEKSPDRSTTPPNSGDYHNGKSRGDEGLHNKTRDPIQLCEQYSDIKITDTLSSDGTTSPGDLGRSLGDNCYSEEVCFGMICGAKAAFIDGFSLDSQLFKKIVTGDSRYLRLKPMFKEGFCVLCLDYSDVGIAVLDTRTTSTLRTVMDEFSINLNIFKDDSLLPNDESRGKTHCISPDTINIVLDIYGPRNQAKAIGAELSKARFYLQRPHSLDISKHYENPHYFKTRKPNSNSAKHRSGSLPEIQLPMSDEPKEEIQASLVEAVLRSRVQNESIKEAEVDSRVRTELLPHQKQALHFIQQRERATSFGGPSLWNIEATRGKPYYQHSIVTDIRTAACPSEARGGILADEMGLGKTLSMISAIVTSLDEARSFLEEQADLRKDGAVYKARATLVIAPSAVLLDGWMAEIQSHVVEGTLNVFKYHGPGRPSTPKQLLDYDIVLTTYATVSTEHSKDSSPLQKIDWFRIVLDEAHFIRNYATKQYQAVCSLTAQHRWCLSGTPVQNSLEDLGSLIKFLRVLYLNRRSDFQRHIISPLFIRKADCTLNLHLLLDAMCLRRNMSLMKLPKTHYQTQMVELSLQERSLYQDILQRSLKEIDSAISSNSSGKAYSSILRAILRTRMLCNYGTFRETTSKSRLATPSMDDESTLASLQEGDEEQQMQSQNVTDYDHHTSRDLLLPTSAISRSAHSTKLSALIRNLNNDLPKGKSIVFSAWKTSLDLIEPLLHTHHLKFVRIDGNVSGNERASIIMKFHTDPSIAIILMTTGTGAVGLNLTIATQVHILEPQWNPSIESQAIGRVLRLTQKNEVTVTRYITRNSIEEQVQDRQNKKSELAELTLNRDMGSEEQMLRRLYNLRSLLCSR